MDLPSPPWKVSGFAHNAAGPDIFDEEEFITKIQSSEMTLAKKINKRPRKIDQILSPVIFEDLEIQKKDMSSGRMNLEQKRIVRK